MSVERRVTRVGALAPTLATTLITAWAAVVPSHASAQDPSTTSIPEAAITRQDERGLPFFLTLGFGYGPRIDGCSQCPEPVSTSSFTGHLSLGKYLVDKLAIGLDASAWRRGQPRPSGTDSTSAAPTARMVGTVGNASVVVSYERWHVFVRGGVGIAFARQDVLDDAETALARGWGVGYTAGVGATLPLVSMISLMAFANYNTGWYDLETPAAIIEQSARHRFIETGFGLTIR